MNTDIKKVKEIFLTPKNVMEYQAEDRGWFWDKCLKLHFELNNMLDEVTNEDKNDWGGEYANFLNSICIEHQTDSGWWNQTAVDIDNIQFFLDYYYVVHEDLLMKKIEDMQKAIKTMKHIQTTSEYIKLNELFND